VTTGDSKYTQVMVDFIIIIDTYRSGVHTVYNAPGRAAVHPDLQVDGCIILYGAHCVGGGLINEKDLKIPRPHLNLRSALQHS